MLAETIPLAATYPHRHHERAVRRMRGLWKNHELSPDASAFVS